MSRAIRKAYTRPELALFRALEKAGVNFITQVPIKTEGHTRPFIVDFLIPSAMLVIEVDSARFHGKQRRRVRDAIRDECLRAAGYSVIRVSDEEVLKDPAAVAEMIKREALRIGGRGRQHRCDDHPPVISLP